MHASCCWRRLASGAADVKPGYVAIEKASGHVGFFDSGGKILKEVKIGGHPHEMTFSPDGRYLYTTDNGVLWMTETGQGGNTVSIVDTRTADPWSEPSISVSTAGRMALMWTRRPENCWLPPNCPACC